MDIVSSVSSYSVGVKWFCPHLCAPLKSAQAGSSVLCTPFSPSLIPSGSPHNYEEDTYLASALPISAHTCRVT